MLYGRQYLWCENEGTNYPERSRREANSSGDIPKYVSAAGDDCAILDPFDGNVVITTDPVPSPAARLIGGDEDLYWMGWLLVTINASDVAASGAVPQAFVAALEMPASLLLDQLHRFLAGIRDSCAANGFAYVGGNLREAPTVGGVGTALGSSKQPPLTRIGARAGDKLIVIGEGGRFWADAERLRLGKVVDRSTSPIFAPVSQARTIHLCTRTACWYAVWIPAMDWLQP